MSWRTRMSAPASSSNAPAAISRLAMATSSSDRRTIATSVIACVVKGISRNTGVVRSGRDPRAACGDTRLYRRGAPFASASGAHHLHARASRAAPGAGGRGAHRLHRARLLVRVALLAPRIAAHVVAVHLPEAGRVH